MNTATVCTKTFRACLTIACVGSLCTPLAAFAARSKEIAYGSVTIKSLGVDEPAILTTNPFYWITGLGQGMRESFASGTSEKALARTETLNKRAAELLKLRSLGVESPKAIQRAVAEYQLAAYQFMLLAGKLDVGTDELLLRSMLKTAVLNVRLADDLLAMMDQSSSRILLLDALERVADAATAIAANIPDIHLALDSFASEELALRDRIRFAEALAIIAKRAAGTEDLVGQELLAHRMDLLSSVATELAGATPSASDLSRSATTMMAVPTALTKMEVSASAPSMPDLTGELERLSGTPTERSNTISYLLSLPEFAENESLVALKNQVLMKVFAK